MRASRLLELLLLLHARRAATAAELAAAVEVSVRTIYRDVDALAAAGVPVYTAPGRNGGIRLTGGYRLAGMAKLDEAEARSLVLAALPATARGLGLEPEEGTRKLLAAMDPRGEAAARATRERLLVEPEPWWSQAEPTPHLLTVAQAVWSTRELRLGYRSAREGHEEDGVVQPLGLVLKAGTWYLVARRRGRGGLRMYRVARIEAAEALPHGFDPPPDFDLTTAWSDLKAAFVASLPDYWVTVRLAPSAHDRLHLLQEGAPSARAGGAPDAEGWTVCRLRFEQPDTALTRLLQLAGEVEILEPRELRQRMHEVTRAAVALHARE